MTGSGNEPPQNVAGHFHNSTTGLRRILRWVGHSVLSCSGIVRPFMRCDQMLKDIATLIEALTKAAWPILAFVLISRFHDEVGAILRRLSEFKKGKLFGQEVEMEDSLNRLQLTAQAVEEKVAAIPPEQGVIESTEPAGSETDKYLIEAARSPRAALIMLAAALVREATTASLGVVRESGVRSAWVHSS